MTTFLNSARKFVKGEEGATMVEYALMVALIAVALIATVKALSSAIGSSFTTTTGQI